MMELQMKFEDRKACIKTLLEHSKKCTDCGYRIDDMIADLHMEAFEKKKKKEKIFDPDETYTKVVRYYVDKLKYPLDRANEIASKVVKEQKARWDHSVEKKDL